MRAALARIALPATRSPAAAVAPRRRAASPRHAADARFAHRFPEGPAARGRRPAPPGAEQPIQRYTDFWSERKKFRYGNQPGEEEDVAVRVVARLDPADPLKGSTPDSHSATEGQRRLYDALAHEWPNETWIRGHLLNAHLGGLGTRENLYPLTSQANSAHSLKVENHLKRWALEAEAEKRRQEQQQQAAGSQPQGWLPFAWGNLWSRQWEKSSLARYEVRVHGAHTVGDPAAKLACTLESKFGTVQETIDSIPRPPRRTPAANPLSAGRRFIKVPKLPASKATGIFATPTGRIVNRLLPKRYGVHKAGLRGRRRRFPSLTDLRALWAIFGWNVHQVVDTDDRVVLTSYLSDLLGQATNS